MRLFLVFILALPAFAQQTWTVCEVGGPCNYSHINTAIQDSANVHCGDTVVVEAGKGAGTGSNGTPLGWYCGGSGTCNANNPVLATQSCTTNPITIITDQSAKLPPETVRITPAYADGASPVVPTIYNPGNGMVLTMQEGNGGTPASGLKVVGVQFCCFSNFSEFIGLGNRGAGTADSEETVVSDVPYDITFDHVIIRSDPLQRMRKGISYDSFSTNITNSWIDAAYDSSSSDSQALIGFMGNGSILNNYISGATETISLGGAMPPVLTPIVAGVRSDNYEITSTVIPGPIDLEWNEITKPLWIYNVNTNWTANSIWAKGAVIHDSAGDTNPRMTAQSTCTTGATQPTWPALNGSVTDGSCTWVRNDFTPNEKNLLECKSCNGWTIENNLFHASWPQGQQGYAITLTSSPSYTTQARVWNVDFENNYLHDVGTGVNTSGQDTLNDLNVYPAIMTGDGPWNITSTNDQLSLTINGTTVVTTLTHGSAQTATNVQSDLTAAFTTAAVGLACLDNLGAVVIRGRQSGNTSTCGGSIGGDGAGLGTHSITVNSVANDAWSTLTAAPGPGTVIATEGTAYFGCQNPRTLTWYACGQFNNLRVFNNLFVNMNEGKFFTGIGYLFDIAQHEEATQYSHNTSDALYGIDGAFGGNLIDGFFMPGVVNWMPFNVLLRDNVLNWEGSGSLPNHGYTVLGGSYYDFSCINFCWGQPSFADSASATFSDSEAPAGIFSHNIIPRATLWSATTRNTSPYTGDTGFNSYPLDNYTTQPTFDPSWRVTNPQGPATDMGAVGADPSTIPRIVNASIQVSDRAAILSYQLTAPIVSSGYGCIAYVTGKDSYYYTQPVAYDAPDSTAPIADQDPSAFTNPGWDGNDAFPQANNQRYVIIGLNSALSPSTTYYLRLQCAGASWPEATWTSATITTNAVETGTRTLTVQRTPSASIGAIATMKVTYGTAYSRASGVISGGGNVSASCTAGSHCSASITATAGAPLYEQVQYLDSGSSVLYSEPVSVVLP